MTINSSDTTITKATQLDSAIPASKITSLSSSEFVGIIADNPDQRIKLKNVPFGHTERSCRIQGRGTCGNKVLTLD